MTLTFSSTKVPQGTRRRGRPPAGSSNPEATRESIIREGMVLLTEKGATATGIDQVLKRAGVPKGSFYHYFSNKDAFLEAVLNAYGQSFARLLDGYFKDEQYSPMRRLQNFIDGACVWMQKHDFRRGCLLGTMGQEMPLLPAVLREEIDATMRDWEQRLAKCLSQSIEAGELDEQADADILAACFWTGWEGAVLRARMKLDTQPMKQFGDYFINSLIRPDKTP
ncbi:TetR/AcrR family transcriptional regulator [Hahella ganghwensis]|uniref:acrylate utilization transcriptional regulator AcuR n=1 Tax=Hahella ganghwensis TaxID=286420 RepID=UPI0012F7615C|nr:TetR/AcrR family transcriptional regulator [Hahella ganghwensis]